jgi:hypothetical protein
VDHLRVHLFAVDANARFAASTSTPSMTAVGRSHRRMTGTGRPESSLKLENLTLQVWGCCQTVEADPSDR